MENTENKHTEVRFGGDIWSYTHNHVYAYIHDEEGNYVFAINTTAPSAELITAAIEGFKAGFGRGKKAGISAQQHETRRVLGLPV